MTHSEFALVDMSKKEKEQNKEWILTGGNGDSGDELNSVFSAADCEDTQ